MMAIADTVGIQSPKNQLGVSASYFSVLDTVTNVLTVKDYKVLMDSGWRRYARLFLS